MSFISNQCPSYQMNAKGYLCPRLLLYIHGPRWLRFTYFLQSVNAACSNIASCAEQPHAHCFNHKREKKLRTRGRGKRICTFSAQTCFYLSFVSVKPRKKNSDMLHLVRQMETKDNSQRTQWQIRPTATWAHFLL